MFILQITKLRSRATATYNALDQREIQALSQFAVLLCVSLRRGGLSNRNARSHHPGDQKSSQGVGSVVPSAAERESLGASLPASGGGLAIAGVFAMQLSAVISAPCSPWVGVSV